MPTLDPVRRRLLIIGSCVAVLTLVVLAAAMSHREASSRPAARGPSVSSAAGASPSSSMPGTPSAGPTPTAAESDQLSRDITALNTMPAVSAATSRKYPNISPTQRLQPDLYAGAFAVELLTQDYRASRNELLSWIQAQSTPSNEPSVVGLVPAVLRPKLAVYSVTSSADGPSSPVPSASEWAAWSRVSGYTTVTLQRVTEPPAWSAAVAAGQLTDPGVTARDVDALVTTHWRQGGTARSATRSVSISVTLEGPPTRGGYGFVCAVTYRSVAVN